MVQGREGTPSESLFGQSENMRQLPTEQSAPKGVEGTSKSGQRPCGAGETTSVHKAGAEVTWFGSHPLIRDPDSAVIKKKKKQRKTIFGLKRSHSRVKIVIFNKENYFSNELTLSGNSCVPCKPLVCPLLHPDEESDVYKRKHL